MLHKVRTMVPSSPILTITNSFCDSDCRMSRSPGRSASLLGYDCASCHSSDIKNDRSAFWPRAHQRFRGGTMMGPSNINWLRRCRPTGVTRALLLVTAVAWGFVAAYVVFGVGGWVAATPTTVQAAAPAGTASLSGMVTSTAPFRAAQVSLRNVDKRILYMVYTSAGQFRAVALFPGNYEVSVATKGLESDVQKVMLKAGDNTPLKLSLRPAQTSTNSAGMEEQSYEEIYPPGPGRAVAERTCIVCHG